MTIMREKYIYIGKISAQPHTTLCIQFLNREKNDKNNTLPLRKHICLTIVWGCAEILPRSFYRMYLKMVGCAAKSEIITSSIVEAD